MERIEDKEGQTANNNRSNTTARQQTMKQNIKKCIQFQLFYLKQ